MSSAEAPWTTRTTLVDQARALGLAPGDVVMIHASLRAVGPVMGGPDTLLDALGEATAPGGTLMMYLACPSPWDDIGCGKLAPEEEALARAHLPAFDPATTRANPSHGWLAELFRTRPGCLTSANPGARMAAFGARAAWLMAGHSDDWGYGPGTPLAKLVEAKGKLLLLGSDRDQATLLHHAEHLAPIPGKREVTLEVPVLRDGARVWARCREYDTSRGPVDWPERFFANVIEGFVAAGGGTLGPVGHAPSLLMDAGPLVAHAVPVMTAEAARLRRP